MDDRTGQTGYAEPEPELISASQTKYESTSGDYETSQGRYEYSNIKYESSQMSYQPHSSPQSEQKAVQSSEPNGGRGYVVTGSGTNSQLHLLSNPRLAISESYVSGKPLLQPRLHTFTWQ